MVLAVHLVPWQEFRQDLHCADSYSGILVRSFDISLEDGKSFFQIKPSFDLISFLVVCEFNFVNIYIHSIKICTWNKYCFISSLTILCLDILGVLMRQTRSPCFPIFSD